ncbi:hypothetical protein B0H17DRAFT_1208865 [Mycena rosella]|uniref:non-specific serine/threonine protein kinase n=1 Tax=Mycena rosella TaxID=1033263 RepID=A0AAD7G6E0_MYCRO|nr:hypothetical protein B0H17DRAFT_1208865 [Mycena rosella]
MASSSLTSSQRPRSSPKAQKQQKVYKAYLTAAPSEPPVLLKHRFHKGYRHPTLDASLTRCLLDSIDFCVIAEPRSGVNVPGVRMVDAAEGVLGIDWIDGNSGKKRGNGSEDEEPDLSIYCTNMASQRSHATHRARDRKMHLADVIHGDLTTSNMMLRHPASFKSRRSTLRTELLVEDKAVDLYVLERAFSSTHPDSEPLFASVLKAYELRMGKEWAAIGRRLDDVRLRGRKRSMVG